MDRIDTLSDEETRHVEQQRADRVAEMTPAVPSPRRLNIDEVRRRLAVLAVEIDRINSLGGRLEQGETDQGPGVEGWPSAEACEIAFPIAEQVRAEAISLSVAPLTDDQIAVLSEGRETPAQRYDRFVDAVEAVLRRRLEDLCSDEYRVAVVGRSWLRRVAEEALAAAETGI